MSPMTGIRLRHGFHEKFIDENHLAPLPAIHPVINHPSYSLNSYSTTKSDEFNLIAMSKDWLNDEPVHVHRPYSRKHFAITIALVLLSFALDGCTSPNDPLRSLFGSYRNYTSIKGKIEANRYYSPTNNFSCAVPPLIEPGAVIRDNLGPIGGTVEFEDDLGTLIRVDYFYIPKEGAGDTATIDGRKFLANLTFNYAVESMYRPVIPATKVTHTEFVELQDGVKDRKDVALFGIAILPKGSSLVETKTGRYDALRASLVFVRGRYTYLLTIQYIPGLFEKFSRKNVAEVPEDERNQRLLKKLEELYQTFLFN